MQEDRPVVLWDRPNTGGSGVCLEATPGVSEAEMAAVKLKGLLSQILPSPKHGPGGGAAAAARVALFGSSNGGRMSVFFASAVAPEMTAGIVLNNITAGPRAAQVLSHEYYGQVRATAPDSFE